MLKNCKKKFYILTTNKQSIFKLFACGKKTYQGKKQKSFEKVIFEYQNVPDFETTDFEPGEFLPRKLTYEPPLLKKYLPKNKPWLEKYRRINIKVVPEPEKPEYTDTPQYPEIKEMSTGFLRSFSKLREKRIDFYKSLEKLNTFDEKQNALCQVWNMPMINLKSWSLNYDYYPLYKYITNTNDFYDKLNLKCELSDSEIDELVKKIKPDILNVIKIYFESEYNIPLNNFQKLKINNEFIPRIKKVDCLLENINSICLKHLYFKNNNLYDYVTDIDCDIRSWWFMKDFENNLKFLYEKMNQPFQYHDHAAVNVRSNKPLLRILLDDDELIKQKVKKFNIHPKKLGFTNPFLCPMTSAGVMPPLNKNDFEFNDFSYLTYLNREYINLRKTENRNDYLDDKEFIQSMAIMHNFSYLNSLSSIHGFTPYSELTYPFINQCIITDGQFWSFHIYQLNAHVFHNDLPLSEKSNQCWSSKEYSLFDIYKNGEFQNVNEDVIKLLIKMYLQKTALDEKITYRPFLKTDTRNEEEKITTRLNFKRKMGQNKTTEEFLLSYGRKVYPFEEIYLRGKFREQIYTEHVFTKTKVNFPNDKLQLGYERIKKKKV